MAVLTLRVLQRIWDAISQQRHGFFNNYGCGIENCENFGESGRIWGNKVQEIQLKEKKLKKKVKVRIENSPKSLRTLSQQINSSYVLGH